MPKNGVVKKNGSKKAEDPVAPPEAPQSESVECQEMVLRSQAQPFEYLQPVMDLNTAKRRLTEFQGYVKFYLKEGEDYGTIPGTKSRTLLKPGSDKLCDIYGLADTYPDSRIKRTENWQAEPPLFDYEVCCVLIHKSTGLVVGEGLGSCNSYEAKYRWRDQGRSCPECGKATILKSKYDDCGWYCFAKKGGCGAKFAFNDPKIVSQPIGRIPNPDIADLKNTILKMAAKRAKVNATISVTRSSGIFTQDVEDVILPDNGNGKKRETAAPVQMEVIEAVEEPSAPVAPEPEHPFGAFSPSLDEYRQWLKDSATLEELTTFFRKGYTEFHQDRQGQQELRRIYERRKVELGGQPNPEGFTRKQARNGAHDRN